MLYVCVSLWDLFFYSFFVAIIHTHTHTFTDTHPYKHKHTHYIYIYIYIYIWMYVCINLLDLKKRETIKIIQFFLDL